MNQHFRNVMRVIYDEYLDEFRQVSKRICDFHYDVGLNLSLNKNDLTVIVRKANVYILNLGLMDFLTQFILNYLFIVHCDRMD